MHLELLVEDASTEAMLNVLLPKILVNATFTISSFQGKQDLLGKLPSRLDGYSHWLPTDWRIIILLDRDDEDCKDLKMSLSPLHDSPSVSTRRRTLPSRNWKPGISVMVRHSIRHILDSVTRSPIVLCIVTPMRYAVVRGRR